MNTGICDPMARAGRLCAGALVSCSVLAGCNPSGEGGFSFGAGQGASEQGAQTGPTVPKTTKTTLARGAVTLKAPQGYCIDETSVSTGLQGSSALLAKCSSLDGKGAGAGAAVMTVSISPRRGAGATAPSSDDLAAAAGPRKILKRQTRGQLALVQLGSGGDDVFAPADPVHWRGATTLDTRLVLLGLFAPEGAALSGPQGGDLLTSLARGISATRGSLLATALNTNGSKDASTPKAQPEPVQNAAATETVEPAKKGLGNFIGRLLNRS